MSESATDLQRELQARIRRELPSLTEDEAADLARSIARLVTAFAPDSIYVFGSHARADANEDSDVDLMVVVGASDLPMYRRAQAARAAIGLHDVPLDVLVWTRAEFERRLANPASFSATILREGRLLHAA